MQVLSTTLCYPTPANPGQGIFVARRLREIAKLESLRVVVPVPWFPILKPAEFDLAPGAHESPPVTYVHMPYIPGAFKFLDPWRYSRALQSAVGTQAPDLIDAHFEWPDGAGAFRVARRLGIKFVCTLRGKLVSQLRYRRRRKAIIEMLTGADAIISVSRALADLANSAAQRDLRIRVIPNGVDTSTFNHRPDRAALRDAHGWSASARYAVSVGHLQELKGFHHLVDLWPRVRERLGDARLILVGGAAGEPAFERSLRRQITAIGLEQSVTLAGRVSTERVAEILNMADLFVLASRSEGWCNGLAESLACGCPVVATEVGGNAEVMNDWGLGRLVPYGNWDAFLERICVAFEDKWDRARIAEYGGRRTWQQVARECVDVFSEVVNRD